MVRVRVGPAEPPITLAAVRMMSKAPASTAPWTQPGAPSYGAVNTAWPMATGGSNSMAMGRATGLHVPITTSKGMAPARPPAPSAVRPSLANRPVGSPSSVGTERSRSSATERSVAAAAARVVGRRGRRHGGGDQAPDLVGQGLPAPAAPRPPRVLDAPLRRTLAHRSPNRST